MIGPRQSALAALAAITLVVLFILSMLSRTSSVAHVAATVTAADSLYHTGSYHEALDVFRRITRENVNTRQKDFRPALDYNIGDTHYRLSRYDESIVLFRKALAGSSEVQERSQFNLGDTYMKKADGEAERKGNLHASISAYEEALLIAPNDTDARWNLELALRKLAEVDAQAGGGRRRGADWGGGNLTKSGYAGAPQTGAGAAPGGGFGGSQGEQPTQQITETRARQLLKAMERAQVTGPEGRGGNQSHTISHRQDW